MFTTLRMRLLVGLAPLLAIVVALGVWAIVMFARLGGNHIHLHHTHQSGASLCKLAYGAQRSRYPETTRRGRPRLASCWWCFHLKSTVRQDFVLVERQV